MALHSTFNGIALLTLLVLVGAEDRLPRKISKVILHQSLITTNKLHNEASDEVSTISAEKHHSIKIHMDRIDQMDPSLRILFNINDLKIGKTMPIFFRIKNSSTSSPLLLQKDAETIPFSSTELRYLLDLFSFSENSPEAKAIESTLKECEFKPLKGETKFCATSLESMLSLTRQVFPKNTKLKTLTTTHLTKSMSKLQNYTILKEPREIFADKVLGCHPLPYPYAVFYCHSQEGGNRLFEVSLKGEDGQRVEAVAVCHMDTSLWDPEHVAFKVLGTEPGKAPVCHFFPEDNLAWVAK